MSTIELPANGWMPREYQQKAWDYFESGGKRGVCLWHRRAGKDWFAVNMIATMMYQRRGLYWHVFPTYAQGKKIIWDSRTNDGRSFLSAFPPELVESVRENEMKVRMKSDEYGAGSVYQVVGADDPDRLVGANPIGIVLSEWSLFEGTQVWDLLLPILAANDGWALFLYTARGKNHGYKLYESAKKDGKWFCELLTVDDTFYEDSFGKRRRVVLESDLEEVKKTMSESMIRQEFYNSFEAPMVGAYYGEQMLQMDRDGRICNVPWEPLLQVHTAWDIGGNDSTAIWYFQVESNGAIRVINYYENNGEGLQHYARELSKHPYTYGEHFMPEDIKVKEIGNNYTSRLNVLYSLGIKNIRVFNKTRIAEGIEMVRNILPKCYIDVTKCDKGIECLRGYRKSWNDRMQCFSDTPMHDKHSHGADAFRILAMGMGSPAHLDRLSGRQTFTGKSFVENKTDMLGWH